MSEVRLMEPAPDAGEDGPRPRLEQPTPLLTLPHAMKVPNVIPTDDDPSMEVWATAIFRVWAPGTAKHCTLCPRSYCRIFQLGLVDACSVGIDGYVGVEDLGGIRSHEDLFVGLGVAGPDQAASPGLGASDEPPGPTTTTALRLRVVDGRGPDDA